MSINATKLHTGPAIIFFNEASQDVDIGATDDGVEVQITTLSIDLTASQFGTTPVDKVITGIQCKLIIPFKEIVLENFQRACAQTTLIVDAITSTKRRLEFRPKPGTSLLNIAKKVTIKPLADGATTTDKEQWIYAPKAAPDADTIALAFSNTAQRMIRATFWCFPDTSNNNRVLYMGDETAT